MNSTDPRPSGKKAGLSNGRLRALRDQPESQSQSQSQTRSRSQSQSQSQSPSQSQSFQSRPTRGQANGSFDARFRTGASANNGSYSYAYALPSSSGRNNSNTSDDDNGDTAYKNGKRTPDGARDSNYRYEYYRDYQSQPPSPTASDGGNRPPFQHHVSFSFHVGIPGGISFGSGSARNEDVAGGNWAGVPMQMPVFGTGFPIRGGQGAGQRGFVNFPSFGLF